MIRDEVMRMLSHRVERLLVRGRAVGVLVATFGLLGLCGVALAGPASAATVKDCGSWHTPAGNTAKDITALGVSCHYARSRLLRAFENGQHLRRWKYRYHSLGSAHGYTIEKVVATKGSDKITFRWKQVIG